MKRESIVMRDMPVRILGAILIVIALLLIGSTEHADRLRAMGEDALGGFVLSGNQAKPGPQSDGQLVFVSGAPQIAQPAHDAQFNVSANAIALVRRVEMFQWHETDGDRRSYDQDWVDHAVDSSKFAQPSGHGNPGAFPIEGARFDSPDVRINGFKLGPELVHGIAGVENFESDLHNLPANMAATFQIHDGALLTSANPASPHVGDLRVTWMRIAPQKITVLARVQNGVLTQASDASGQALARVQIGKRSLSDIVPNAAQRPNYAWAKRVLAILLAWTGALLLLARRDPILALLSAIVPLALLDAAFWFSVRNATAWVLVLIAILAAIGATWLWRRAPAISAQAVRRESSEDENT